MHLIALYLRVVVQISLWGTAVVVFSFECIYADESKRTKLRFATGSNVSSIG